MDACHSGEVDKDDIIAQKKKSTKKGKVKFRAASDISITTKTNTFEIMKTIFADLRRGSGAMVISSAGGTEYAQESDDWGNGAFTMSLLNGLKEGEADLDHNGTIMFGELLGFLKVEVPRLTNGNQKPTSRVENLAKDIEMQKSRKKKRK